MSSTSMLCRFMLIRLMAPGLAQAVSSSPPHSSHWTLCSERGGCAARSLHTGRALGVSMLLASRLLDVWVHVFRVPFDPHCTMANKRRVLKVIGSEVQRCEGVVSVGGD